MTTAFNLFTRVIRREVPPKILTFGMMNTFNRWFGTGHRRFEFERLYTEQVDPWDYRSSPYEHSKYDKTLAIILEQSQARSTVLEIGCSIGQFSGRLAEVFDEVTCVDFSEQALSAARGHNAAHRNIQFVRAPLQKLALGRRHDVIICAEVLYYIDKSQVGAVLERLDEHLAPGGIIVTVADVPQAATADHYAEGWEEELAARFDLVADEVVADPLRPYRMCVFRAGAIL